MNPKLLKKCIDKLNEESPDLSYVKGILETLLELNGGDTSVPVSIVPPILGSPTMFSSKVVSVTDLTDEERDFHDKMLGGPVASMRDDS